MRHDPEKFILKWLFVAVLLVEGIQFLVFIITK